MIKSDGKYILFYFINFAIQIGQKEIVYNNSVYTLHNTQKKQIQEEVRKQAKEQITGRVTTTVLRRLMFSELQEW